MVKGKCHKFENLVLHSSFRLAYAVWMLETMLSRVLEVHFYIELEVEVHFYIVLQLEVHFYIELEL